MAQGSKTAVLSALAGNAAVMVAKFIGFAVTGSGAMLSEAIHTCADLLNQFLLFIGITRSGKDPDPGYQYGYGAERYVWALISAVGIFFLGCGVTVYHGVNGLMHPHELTDLGWAIGVLAVSFLIEGFILAVAVRSVKKDAAGAPFLRFLRTEADPSAAAVILEDFAACLGVIIALSAIVLTRLTGQLYWDAIGSILVGLLLGAVAIWLIARNRDLLVGPGIPPRIQDQVRRIMEQNPTVEEVVDLRTRVLDTETYRIRAKIRFDGASLATKLEAKLQEAHGNIAGFDDFKRFAVDYADEIVDLLADEIDAIEREVRRAVPKARHLDLEAE